MGAELRDLGGILMQFPLSFLSKDRVSVCGLGCDDGTCVLSRCCSHLRPDYTCALGSKGSCGPRRPTENPSWIPVWGPLLGAD